MYVWLFTSSFCLKCSNLKTMGLGCWASLNPGSVHVGRRCVNSSFRCFWMNSFTIILSPCLLVWEYPRKWGCLSCCRSKIVSYMFLFSFESWVIPSVQLSSRTSTTLCWVSRLPSLWSVERRMLLEIHPGKEAAPNESFSLLLLDHSTRVLFSFPIIVYSSRCSTFP